MQHQTRFLTILATLTIVLSACGGGSGADGSDRSRQGGDTTTENRSSLGFEDPAVNLNDEQLEQHLVGDVAFEAKFVTSPAPINPGLGPIFNNRSCAGCHTKNGRGAPILGQGNLGSQALVRVSTAAGEEVPGIGSQIQDHAIFGQNPEAKVELTWQTVSGNYGDGTEYQLRSPVTKITLTNGSQLPASTLTSLRIAPPVFGLGLLEAIPEATIRSLEDPSDSNGDGISGRANNVFDVISQTTVMGRFGHKANQPNLMQQTARAYLEDMGVNNPIFPAADGTAELDTDTLVAATFYVQSIAVPRAVQIDNPNIIRGEELFKQANCSGCHTPKHVTGEHELSAVANQTIYPYTDLLLHDMGEGLADNRPDFEANGQEWRTTPLWGIGLTKPILGINASYLHDGRARSLDEAILWHGGEAEAAKEMFRTMTAEDRNALVSFLHSL